jgi:hypothetical protein
MKTSLFSIFLLVSQIPIEASSSQMLEGWEDSWDDCGVPIPGSPLPKNQDLGEVDEYLGDQKPFSLITIPEEGIGFCVNRYLEMVVYNPNQQKLFSPISRTTVNQCLEMVVYNPNQQKLFPRSPLPKNQDLEEVDEHLGDQKPLLLTTILEEESDSVVNQCLEMVVYNPDQQKFLSRTPRTISTINSLNIDMLRRFILVRGRYTILPMPFKLILRVTKSDTEFTTLNEKSR